MYKFLKVGQAFQIVFRQSFRDGLFMLKLNGLDGDPAIPGDTAFIGIAQILITERGGATWRDGYGHPILPVDMVGELGQLGGDGVDITNSMDPTLA